MTMTDVVWFKEVKTGGCLQKREKKIVLLKARLFLSIVIVIFPLAHQGEGNLATSYSYK